MRTTITDVAKQAGVSMKTVSRVLNNEPNVAKATRERVMEAAERLDYSPNLAARGLASSRSYLIALLYDNPSPSYITNIQRGAIEACRKHGYHLLLEPMTADQAKSSEAESILRRMNVDGVILTPPLCDLPELRGYLSAQNIRHVAVSPETLGGQSAVRMDDEEAAYQMTRHLIEQGHHDIGFIIGHPDHAASAWRKNGFKRALSEAGITLGASRLVQGDFSFRSGVEAAQTMLTDGTSRPTAIFASNDDMAAGVVNVAARLGITIPDDLSVVGFDDTPMARILWPQLTTVAQPIHEMGCKAAKLLLDQEQASQTLTHTLDFKLQFRDSTAPAPGH